MASYAVVDWASDVGTLLEVIAAIETKLETLDSTTNGIRLLEVHPTGGAYVAILVYDG